MFWLFLFFVFFFFLLLLACVGLFVVSLVNYRGQLGRVANCVWKRAFQIAAGRCEGFLLFDLKSLSSNVPKMCMSTARP